MSDSQLSKVGKSIQDITEKTFNFIIFVSMSVMVILVFLNAVLRYGFHSSIPESEELARYFFIWSSFLGIIAAYQKNSHVGVDLLKKRLKGISLLSLNIFGECISIFAFLVMLFGGFGYFNVIGDAKGQATGIPLKFIAISIIFTSVALIVLSVIRMMSYVIQTLKGE